MGFLTGKSKSKSTQTSESKNLAHPYIQDTYNPVAKTGVDTTSLISKLLGVNGDAEGGFNNFKNSIGYQHTFDEGQRAVTGSYAGRGLAQSGAAMKALQDRGQETAKSSFLAYLQSLLGLSGQGLQAGGLIGSTGGVAKSSGTSTSSSKPGLGSTIGAAMSMIPSDPRLKTDIDMVGTAENGLGIYRYRYLWDDVNTVRIGYMANEVAELAPHALGPELPGGFMTVDYSKLPEISDA